MNRKAREALAEIVEYAQSAACHNTDAHVDHYLSQIIAWGKKALNEPLRNCDVGTPEEQGMRMAKFCREQYKKTDGVSLCSSCPFHNNEGLECQFEWAQMPYESEVK
jgi:hypothetical protein